MFTIKLGSTQNDNRICAPTSSNRITDREGKETVAFWVTNPCRITRKEFLMKQTKMYVCTLEEFILVDVWIHCCTWMNWICIGNAVVYIQSQQWKRNVRIALRSQLTSED